MKRWVPYITFSVLLLLSAGEVFAQDAGMSDVEMLNARDASEAERVVLAPGEVEVRYVPRASGVYAPSDSLTLFSPSRQPAVQKPSEADEKPATRAKDDSILTFNFLYYIIQKYKLQDIID